MTANPLQQVSQYKLLGVIINTGLKWDDHVNAITSKAAKRLWFLKKLKRAGVSREDLLHFFQAAVRPILEYACQAWHTSLTKEQSKSLENIQRRALQIIVGNVSYEVACDELSLSTLADRRASICSTLFRQITYESHVLHYLLPAQTDAEIASRLRSTNKNQEFVCVHLDTKTFYTICAFELSVTLTLSPLYFCLFFIV